MNVLVTGGAGFIGSHTVDLLTSKGHNVKIFDSLEEPVHSKNIKPTYIKKNLEFIIGNIQDRTKLENALSGVDVVFHLAAHQDYLPKFSKFAYTNDGGTALLYEIIVDKHLPIEKVVLASSQAVYGEGKYECHEHGLQYPGPRDLSSLSEGQWNIQCSICNNPLRHLYTDEKRVNPHNQYAVSKYAQELYALILGKRFDIPTVALRYTICQGPRQSFRNTYSGILRVFLVCLLNNLPLPIFEDGHQLRDYVYVKDVAKANLLVMENDASNYEVFNVGSGNPTSVIKYANILIKLSGKDVKSSVTGQFRLGDTRHIVSDISKLTNLGWTTSTGVEDIAREYLEWLYGQDEVNDTFTKTMEEMKRAGVIREIK